MAYQLSLLDIKHAYCETEKPLSNMELYAKAAFAANIPESVLNKRSPIGEGKTERSPIKRKIRWFQQTLKAMGVIEKVEGRRGIWQFANKNKKGLHEAVPRYKLAAYSTRLGVSLWAESKSVFSKLEEPIHLCLTSPPYPLKNQRNYGNVSESAWVDFITEALEPIVANLVAGGSVVLNVSNDIFEHKRPSRSLYLERMVLALHDRLGLSLMDRIPWVNYSKLPGPTQWSCVKPYQLCSAWEPIYWFTNDPDKVRSNNRAVLQEHTERQKKLMDNGGEQRTATYGDGAYHLKTGKSFSKKNKRENSQKRFSKRPCLQGYPTTERTCKAARPSGSSRDVSVYITGIHYRISHSGRGSCCGSFCRQ